VPWCGQSRSWLRQISSQPTTHRPSHRGRLAPVTGRTAGLIVPAAAVLGLGINATLLAPPDPSARSSVDVCRRGSSLTDAKGSVTNTGERMASFRVTVEFRGQAGEVLDRDTDIVFSVAPGGTGYWTTVGRGVATKCAVVDVEAE
jgi:hypothetical protein